MRFNRLDLNLLVALEVLLTECSTTKAANRLFISQPATSAILSRLREHFGDPLLQPMGRIMVRTPRGDSLLGPVREVLQQLSALADVGAHFDPLSANQHFRIAATDYAVSTLIVPLANRIAELAPGISLEIHPLGPATDLALARRDIDLVIAPREYVAGDHRQQTLLVDDYVCVFWDRHPDIDAGLALEQYAALPHVAVQFASDRLPGSQDQLERQIPVQRRFDVKTPNFSCLPEFLVGSRRIATLRRGMVEQFLPRYPLRLLPLPFPVAPAEEVMQWSSIVETDPSHRWLRESLELLAQQHKIGSPAPTTRLVAVPAPAQGERRGRAHLRRQ